MTGSKTFHGRLRGFSASIGESGVTREIARSFARLDDRTPEATLLVQAAAIIDSLAPA